MMAWTITDRATRISFYGCLALAALALVPVLAGDLSIPLMVLVLVLVYQAWRLAMARQVAVRLDEGGITKSIGARTWRLEWERVTAVRLVQALGTGQLVARTTDPIAWNPSDKLFWKLGRTEVAVQVPPALVPELRAFLAGLGMDLGAGPGAVAPGAGA
jgi:hypothetical protein